MSDYADTLRQWLAHMVSHDPVYRRFGARQHRYQLRPPLGAARVAAIEAELGLALPPDYRAHVLEVGDGGAGPYHGLLPLDHPIQRAAAAGTFAPDRPGRALYQGVVGLEHVGCGYLTFLIVRGAAAGQVWIDRRGAGEGVAPIHPDFASYVRAWIEGAAQNQLPPAWVAPGRCALPHALSSYLAGRERAAGVAPGTLGPAGLRAAFDALGPSAIRTAASGDDPFFAADEPIDPCPSCEVMIENLLARGLRREQLAVGLPPTPLRP